MGKKKKLTSVEIEAAINGIRKKYNDYMVEFMKPSRARNLFEDRYIDALRARIDLDRFIYDEMLLVQQLIDDEKEKQQKELEEKENKRNKKIKKKAEKESIVDKIFEANREKIRKYQGLGLEDDDVYEIDKLFGAVKELEKKYWSGMEGVFRKLYTSRYSGPRRELESRLFELTLEGPEGYPPALLKLRTILDRYPREYSALQRESQRCMMDISFLLHSMYEELEKIKDDESLDNKDRKTIEISMDFVHTVIEDFRLTDINASKIKGVKK